jgi:GNAT superfamily N-acetyltransferase
MTIEMTVRLAQAGDAVVMPGLEQSAGELFRTLPGWAWLADGDNRALDTYRTFVAGGWCWVAEDHRRIVRGFIAAEHVDDELHIHELAVTIGQQRRGIGSALMKAAISAAIAAKLRAVTLTTFLQIPWNEPAYARMGFVRLASDELGPRLSGVLEQEAKAGLPRDLRCAMRLPIATQ